MYQILLVFEISNSKISILSRFQAFIKLRNIPYLEFSCLNVSQENESEVEKEIIWKDYIIKNMVQLLTGLGFISSIFILYSQIIRLVILFYENTTIKGLVVFNIRS